MLCTLGRRQVLRLDQTGGNIDFVAPVNQRPDGVSVKSGQGITIDQLVLRAFGWRQVLQGDRTGGAIDLVAPVDKRPDVIAGNCGTSRKPLRRGWRRQDRAIRRAQQDIAGANHANAGIEQDVALLRHHADATTGGADVVVQRDTAATRVQADVAGGCGNTALQREHIDIAAKRSNIDLAAGRLLDLPDVHRSGFLDNDFTQTCIPEIHFFNLSFEWIGAGTDAMRRVQLQGNRWRPDIGNPIGKRGNTAAVNNQIPSRAGAQTPECDLAGRAQPQCAGTGVNHGLAVHRQHTRSGIERDGATSRRQVTLARHDQAGGCRQRDSASVGDDGLVERDAARCGDQ